MSIRTRLLVIAGLVALSIFFLVPRTITVRERDPQTGVMIDRKEKRVPVKLGLDLQGGMHLALELDQSKQVSADPKRDLDLALTVLRKRIDEFGVTEPLVQKVGDSRIVVELAGIRSRRAPKPSSNAAHSSSFASRTRPTRSRRPSPRWIGPCAHWGSRATPAPRSRPSRSFWVATPPRPQGKDR